MTPRTDVTGLDIEEPRKSMRAYPQVSFYTVADLSGLTRSYLGIVDLQNYLLQEPRPDVKQVMQEPLLSPKVKGSMLFWKHSGARMSVSRFAWMSLAGRPGS